MKKNTRLVLLAVMLVLMVAMTVMVASAATIDVAKAGLKGSPTKVKKTFVPQKKTGGIKIAEESAEASSKKLLDLLRDAAVI